MDSDRTENIICELEANSKKLKEYTKLYSELNALKETIVSNTGRYELQSDRLDKSRIQLGKCIEDTKKTNKTLLDKLDVFYQDNRDYRVNIDNLITSELKKNKSDLSVLVRDENSRLIRNIEIYMSKKFEVQQSDISKQMDEQVKLINKIKILSVFNILVVVASVAAFIYLK